MRRFDPARPATWTWAGLNAWLMAPTRTTAALRAALRAEARGARRLTYQLRLQARLGRLESVAAKRRLVAKKLTGGDRKAPVQRHLAFRGAKQIDGLKGLALKR